MQLPSKTTPPQIVLEKMQQLRSQDYRWQDGKVWSLVYYAGEEVYQLVKEAFNLYFSENGLNPTVFPSLRKFETEVIRMTAFLLGGNEETAGTMTSGGTESILMAVKTAREYARAHQPQIKKPEMILPSSAHPAFQKAAHYFDIVPIVVPVTSEYQADVKAIEQKICSQTILLVASAPSYPHGILDPIAEIGKLAQENNILFHVDACIGGFILPFLQKLGYPIPPFGFEVPGVTSISTDIHKYGYAAKGASVILYKNREIRKHQFFVYTEWPGGIYGSPSVAGTRPGGAIAAAWAVMNHLGEEGYLRLAQATMQAAQKIKEGIQQIEDLYIIGNPCATLLAFGSSTVDIYAIADEMTQKGWHIDRQQFPPCLHLTVNYIHTSIVDQFLADLKEATKRAKKSTVRNITNKMIKGLVKTTVKFLPPHWVSKLTVLSSSLIKAQPSKKRSAAMYGMMGELPNRGDLHELVLNFMDKLNSFENTSNSKQ
ncbi:MAG: aspartate aminotransferase family protein [Bacteroidia bacterium]|nr:aspartate aminotransferase family protein [Bacteroidia bacterium]MDW8159753.1 aspartate aminotransferase family protein [Bacteroidia bacterium]